jgi:hypothetical protein
MSAHTQPSVPVDLAQISDPDVRRAIRSVYGELSETIQRQQMEIEALLEMMVDKHVGSISEFKRSVQKLQQGGVKAGRVHEAIESLSHPHTGPSVAPRAVTPA